MYDIIKDDTTYMFPNGKSYLGSEIKNMDPYKVLQDTDNFGIDLRGSMIVSIVDFTSFKEQNGLPSDASLEDMNEVYKKQNEMHQVSVNYMSSMLKVSQIAAMSFTDEQALEVKDIYPDFQVNHEYKQGEFFTYNGELYKVNQNHTSAGQWEPGSVGTESLYTHLTLNEDGYPIWQKPTGAHDAYNTGDIVEYNGELYKSLIDGNAYSPDEYPAGWEKYTEPTS